VHKLITVFLGTIAAAALPIAEAANLPDGIAQSVYTTGLTRPTQITFAPDGRLFVCEKSGTLRIIKNGILQPTPFLTVPVNDLNERGLMSIAFDPNFASNNYVYVFYTANVTPVHNRVSRFTANGDFVLPGTERILLEWDASRAGYHQGGGLHFGTDGKLYISVGENTNSLASQSLNSLLGKILRINTDGTIPTDNPFYNTTSGDNRAIVAYGLRNPYTFAIQPGTGFMLIADVGQDAWEEINWGIFGANYGWPTTEGPTSDPRFIGPLFAYQHHTGAVQGCAVIGAAYYNTPNRNLPDQYYGKFFFGDNCNGWIRTLDPVTHVVGDFATGGVLSPSSFAFGPDGALYYSSYHTDTPGDSAIYRIASAGDRPAITEQPQNKTVTVGQTATFFAGASGAAPLGYQWQKNRVNIPGATFSSYTTPATTLADNGSTYRVVVSNSFGSVTSNEAVLTVTSNRAPTARILTPAAGTLYTAGTNMAFSGDGTDPEDGALPASAFTWEVVFHHATHTHPFLPPRSGFKSGTFYIPNNDHTESDVWYRIHLTVTDSGGLTSTVIRDVFPRKSNITLNTVPTGLQVTTEGQPKTAPYTVTSVVGVIRLLGVVTPQTKNGIQYRFKNWSDGGTESHNIVTQPTNATYTATFEPVCAVDVTNRLSIIRSGYRRNATTGRYVQTVTLRNITGTNVSGPVSLVLDGLSLNASLFAPVGRTVCAPPLGSVYTNVNIGVDNILSPNESTAVILEFTNPSNQGILYTPRILSGTGTR